VITTQGYDWIRYSSPQVSVLYPNGWDSYPTEWMLDNDIDQVSFASEDYLLDLSWSDFENDIDWLFERNNQKSTLMQSFMRDIEKNYLEDIAENVGEVVQFDRFEQAELGDMPTVGGYVYEIEVTNNWEDGDKLYIGYGDVLCGPSRLCHVEYQKIDEPFTERDWAILDTFTGSAMFK